MTAASKFPYHQAEREHIPCNLCGNREFKVIEFRDRNQLPVQTVLCKKCGLLFLSPRMTAGWYGRYYQEEYRPQMARFKGRRLEEFDDLESLYNCQRRHGAWLAGYLRDAGVNRVGSVLELGSSAGGILAGLADAFGCQVQGIEPSPAEARFACEKGVPTTCGLLEEVSLAGKFDLVLSTQSFNHLLDPAAACRRARDWLHPTGAFLLECQNFLHVCQRRLAIYEAIQIDHVYMFTPTTLQAMAEANGFTVDRATVRIDAEATAELLQQQKQAGAPTLHARFLAHPSALEGKPIASSASVAIEEIRRLPNQRVKATMTRHFQTLKRVARLILK